MKSILKFFKMKSFKGRRFTQLGLVIICILVITISIFLPKVHSQTVYIFECILGDNTGVSCYSSRGNATSRVNAAYTCTVNNLIGSQWNNNNTRCNNGSDILNQSEVENKTTYVAESMQSDSYGPVIRTVIEGAGWCVGGTEEIVIQETQEGCNSPGGGGGGDNGGGNSGGNDDTGYWVTVCVTSCVRVCDEENLYGVCIHWGPQECETSCDSYYFP